MPLATLCPLACRVPPPLPAVPLQRMVCATSSSTGKCMHAQRHTHAHSETHTCTHRDIHMHIQRHTHARTETYTCTHRDIHMHAQRHTHARTETYTCTYAYLCACVCTRVFCVCGGADALPEGCSSFLLGRGTTGVMNWIHFFRTNRETSD
jgi:hypothetical protein